MFDFFKKPAAIVRVDEKDKVEVSPDFNSVTVANHALSTHLAGNGSIVVSSSVNDYDGKVVTAIEKSLFKPKTWFEIGYEVLPSDIIENGEEG
jgi:hypothetical protein